MLEGSEHFVPSARGWCFSVFVGADSLIRQEYSGNLMCLPSFGQSTWSSAPSPLLSYGRGSRGGAFCCSQGSGCVLHPLSFGSLLKALWRVGVELHVFLRGLSAGGFLLRALDLGGSSATGHLSRENSLQPGTCFRIVFCKKGE